MAGRTYTRAELRTRARRIAGDMPATGLVGDPELNEILDTKNVEFVEKVSKSGLPYFEATQTISTDGTNQAYTLPTRYMFTVRVDYAPDANSLIPLRELHAQEIHGYATPGSTAVGFRVVQDNILLYPRPPASQTYKHIHILSPAKMTSDSDTIDGYSGLEQWIAVAAAIEMLWKEASDTSHLERELARLELRLQEAAEMRSMYENGRIIDVSAEQPLPGDYVDRRGFRGWR